MPYYIAVYDIGVKRGPKMLKLFRRYLTWVQNSVFEGDMTRAQFQALQAEAQRLMQPAEDSVIFYELRDERYSERTTLGTEAGERGRFL
jgi:CRISPR-associated protein Cas2